MVFTTWFREISYCRSVSASRLMRRIGTCGRVSVAAHGIRPGYLGIGVAKFPRNARRDGRWCLPLPRLPWRGRGRNLPWAYSLG